MPDTSYNPSYAPFPAASLRQAPVPATVHNVPSSIAASGSITSSLIVTEGFSLISVGVIASQAGTLSVQRYLDAGGTVIQGTASQVALTAGTPANLDVLDGKPFASFKLIITNSGGSISTLTNFALLLQASAAQSSSGGTTSSTTVPLVVNGSTITRPANTTAYAFGTLVANSTTAASVVPANIAAARAAGTASTILRCRLLKSGTVITNAIFRLHFYTISPTVSNGDGAVWLSNNTASYIGSMDVTIDKAMSDGSFGNGVPSIGSTLSFNPAVGSSTIYCLIEARAAYTPISGEVFTPVLEVQ